MVAAMSTRPGCAPQVFRSPARAAGSTASVSAVPSPSRISPSTFQCGPNWISAAEPGWPRTPPAGRPRMPASSFGTAWSSAGRRRARACSTNSASAAGALSTTASKPPSAVAVRLVRTCRGAPSSNAIGEEKFSPSIAAAPGPATSAKAARRISM